MSDAGKNWNVVTGCDKYSDGCLNCYAEDVVEWLKGLGQKAYVKNGFNLTCHYDKLDWPLTNLAKKPKKPAKSFVTDMGDLFHVKVPDDFIAQVFEAMIKVPQHRFYVLTKRAERLGGIGPRLPWRPWIWAGVTVESEKYVNRIDHLKKLPPEVNKFIMMEPLLSPMPKLDFSGINWVVVGGESNKKERFRPINEGWVAGIHQSVDQPVPVIGGLNHQSFELIPKRFQCLQNNIKIVGDSLFKDAFEIGVQNPNVGIC